MIKFIYHKHIAFILFLSILIVGCSGNDEGSGIDNPRNTEKVEIVYQIKALNVNDANASDKEMMKDILLIIVKSDNIVEKIISANLPSTQEDYKIQTQLSAGTKTVYGFANLSEALKLSTGIASLTEGGIMPDFNNKTCIIENGYQINEVGNKWLPMSNKVNITVTNVSGQTFSMYLIRLVNKIKFNFQNKTGYTINLKEISISPITSSAIYLLPRTDQNSAPVLPTPISTQNFTYTFDSSYSIEDKNNKEYTTYLNESSVANDGWFNIILKTKKNGGSIDKRVAVTNLSYLNRNDYLPLDLILTDYKLELELRSYPPIGGYPASMQNTEDDYYCKFPGGGAFVIIPKLKNLSTGSYVTVSDSEWTFSVTDASPSILDKAPVLKNGEIIGTIKASVAGKALCNISISRTESEGISRVLSYKVYISQN